MRRAYDTKRTAHLPSTLRALAFVATASHPNELDPEYATILDGLQLTWQTPTYISISLTIASGYIGVAATTEGWTYSTERFISYDEAEEYVESLFPKKVSL